MAEIKKEQLDAIYKAVLKRLLDNGNFKLPESAIKEVLSRIDIEGVASKVRALLPTPQDGKNAEITDELISLIVVKTLERVQEINQVKDGRDGQDGDQGQKGDRGEIGFTGAKGDPGRNGTDGLNGRDGQPGQNGINAVGKQGVRGLTGKDGRSGKDAIDGKDGIDGKDYVVSQEELDGIVGRIDFSRFMIQDEFDKVIEKLKKDLQTGKVKTRHQPVGGGGPTPTQIVNAINKLLGSNEWQSPSIDISNAGVVVGRRDNENYTGGANVTVVSTDDALNERINTIISIIANPAFDSVKINDVVKTYLKGQIHFNPADVTHTFDTAISGVRLNAGQEEYFLVYNDTASIIANGKACYASGVNVANNILTVDLADSSSFLTSAQTLGLATHDIGIGEMGLVTNRGIVRDWDTTITGFGLSYLSTSGDVTNIKPLYPNNRVIMGALIKSHATEGQFQVSISSIMRRSASRSYSFTSSDAAAGTHYRAGFYHWSASSITLNQGSLTVNYGDANVTRAGHVGVVAQALGTVDTGQVGLQVTGTLDSELGPQVAAQTAIITDDITTLTANQMEESLEKFSGIVTISLYVVSGAPVNYSLTFNYGFSKYEDFRNIDGTVTAFNAVWEAGAADSIFNVSLKFHNPVGWTYAATGFVPGNGNICSRLVDQAIDSNLIIGEEGSYKRVNLLQFVNGSAKEGVIIEIITGANNSIRNMDLHISAFSEELF